MKIQILPLPLLPKKTIFLPIREITLANLAKITTTVTMVSPEFVMKAKFAKSRSALLPMIASGALIINNASMESAKILQLLLFQEKILKKKHLAMMLTFLAPLQMTARMLVIRDCVSTTYASTDVLQVTPSSA